MKSEVIKTIVKQLEEIYILEQRIYQELKLLSQSSDQVAASLTTQEIIISELKRALSMFEA